jgi:exodeoxyribonuclease VII large subunit
MRAIAALIERRYARLDRSEQLLEALSYHGVLARGFALVRSERGEPVRKAAAVLPAMRLDIEFADGRVGATADGGAAAAPASGARPAADDPVKPRPRRREVPGQGSLF